MSITKIGAIAVGATMVFAWLNAKTLKLKVKPYN